MQLTFSDYIMLFWIIV